MRFTLVFISGLIFGTGLLVSGMANPLKVQNFLDVFGTWDPSLAFVMGGAIAVTLPGYHWLRSRGKPVVDTEFHWPTRNDIDTKLIAGSALFGLGWGLGGLCPGPALTSLPFLATGTLVFVPAMLAGLAIAKVINRPRSAESRSPATSQNAA